MKKIVVGLFIILALMVGLKLISPKVSNIEKLSLKSSTQNKKNDFKELLAYVPENTSFLFGNREAIPTDYLDKKVNYIEKLINTFRKIIEDIDANISSNSVENFVFNYYDEFLKNYKNNTLENMGYSKGEKSVIYEYEYAPIVRSTIRDSKKFIDSINLIAKESNLSLEWKECGEFKCISPDNNESDMLFTLVVKNKSTILSIYKRDIKNKILKHLIEKPNIKNSYSIKKFNNFLKENGFRGYGDGFINITKVANYLIPKSNIDKNCSKLILDITKKADRLSIGMPKLSKRESDMIMILNLDKNLTNSIKEITNNEIFIQRAKRPLFDFGFNINAQGLSNTIMNFSDYMAKKSSIYGCSEINANELRQGAFMASMSIGMALGQISQVHFSLNELEIDKKNGGVSRVSAIFQIASPNPTSLVNMVKMLSPEFASLNIPTDGTEIDIAKFLDKPLPPPAPEIKVSIKGKVITLRVGEKVDMQKNNLKDNTIFWSGVDYKKYYKLLLVVMEKGKEERDAELNKTLNSIPQENREEIRKALKNIQKDSERAKQLIEILYDFNSTSSTAIYFDNRGVVLEINEREE